MTELLHDCYRLDEVIGQGAMGVVWRAHDEVLDRPIAIKELRPAAGVDPTEALDRFLVEARAAARLSHPNIVGVHDVFSDGQRVLIVMELIEGPTLDLVVGSHGAQSPEVVRAVMAQVAQALAKAHGAGVIHRDLKPDNIFWTQDRAVVADFGLARIGGGRGTVEGTVMGTPGYMVPEQIKGTAVGPPADIFGWRAVAYYRASGLAPFGEQEKTDSSALAYRIVHQDPPPLHLPDDPALAGLIESALAKDPAQRPHDGVALVGRLTEGVVETDPEGQPAVSATELRRPYAGGEAVPASKGSSCRGSAPPIRPSTQSRPRRRLPYLLVPLMFLGILFARHSVFTSAERPLSVGSGPLGVATDSANIWTANNRDGTVTKLRASDGTILETFSVGADPVNIAFEGANISVPSAPAHKLHACS